jgi:hypothetical protein
MTPAERAAEVAKMERLRRRSAHAFRQAVRQRDGGNLIGASWYAGEGDDLARQATEIEYRLEADRFEREAEEARDGG